MKALKVASVVVGSWVVGYGVSILHFCRWGSARADSINAAVACMWMYEHLVAYGDIPPADVTAKANRTNRSSPLAGVTVRREEGKAVLAWPSWSRARVEVSRTLSGDGAQWVEFYTHRGDLLGRISTQRGWGSPSGGRSKDGPP